MSTSYYKTPSSLPRMLKVSTGVRNRALQLLVKRDLIHRRQRSGTLITEPVEHAKSLSVDRVHLLVHRNFLKSAQGFMPSPKHTIIPVTLREPRLMAD